MKKLSLFDYYDVIKKPMDFSTIKSKLEANLYDSNEKFVEDVELVFENCQKYNGENNDCSKIARTLNEIFKDIYAKTFVPTKPLEPIQSTPIKADIKEKISHNNQSKSKDETIAKLSPQETPKPKEPIVDSRSLSADDLEKDEIVQRLFKIESIQDQVMQEWSKMQDLMTIQGVEIDELEQKLKEKSSLAYSNSSDKPGDTSIADFCDTGSMMSNMSESILSSSTSTISNSRKSKRIIRPPKNKLSDSISTPQSASGKKSLSSSGKFNSRKRCGFVWKETGFFTRVVLSFSVSDNGKKVVPPQKSSKSSFPHEGSAVANNKAKIEGWLGLV